MRDTVVFAFAVDRHRRGDDERESARRSVHEALQEASGCGSVHLDVAFDLVHRLPHADGGGEVYDGADTHQRLLDQFGVAYVSSKKVTPAGMTGCSPPCTCGSRLSMTTTSAPSLTRRETRCEPMKPAPPVTKIRSAMPVSFAMSPVPRARSKHRLSPSIGWLRSDADRPPVSRRDRYPPSRGERDCWEEGRDPPPAFAKDLLP